MDLYFVYIFYIYRQYKLQYTTVIIIFFCCWGRACRRGLDSRAHSQQDGVVGPPSINAGGRWFVLNIPTLYMSATYCTYTGDEVLYSHS